MFFNFIDIRADGWSLRLYVGEESPDSIGTVFKFSFENKIYNFEEIY